MFTDALTLIDQTIENLETLAAVFADELDERMHNSALPPTAHISRNAYMKIGALLPALRAARATQEAHFSGSATGVSTVTEPIWPWMTAACVKKYRLVNYYCLGSHRHANHAIIFSLPPSRTANRQINF